MHTHYPWKYILVTYPWKYSTTSSSEGASSRTGSWKNNQHGISELNWETSPGSSNGIHEQGLTRLTNEDSWNTSDQTCKILHSCIWNAILLHLFYFYFIIINWYRKPGWVDKDFEVFFIFLHKPHSFLNFFWCQFHDPYLEKASSENFIKLITFSVFFLSQRSYQPPPWKGWVDMILDFYQIRKLRCPCQWIWHQCFEKRPKNKSNKKQQQQQQQQRSFIWCTNCNTVDGGETAQRHLPITRHCPRNNSYSDWVPGLCVMVGRRNSSLTHSRAPLLVLFNENVWFRKYTFEKIALPSGNLMCWCLCRQCPHTDCPRDGSQLGHALDRPKWRRQRTDPVSVSVFRVLVFRIVWCWWGAWN